MSKAKGKRAGLGMNLFPTSTIVVILTEIKTFMSGKCLAKVLHQMEKGLILSSVLFNLIKNKIPVLELDIVERQV